MMVTKTVGRRNRQAGRYRLALVFCTLAAAGLAACRESRESAPAAEVLPPKQELNWAGEYAMANGTLYRRRDGVPEAVAVLPGAGVGVDTIIECAVHAPELGKASFRLLQLAPDSSLAAWATTGPGTCVGTLSGREPSVRVLGYWPAAVTDSLLWSPAGGYLGVWLDHHGRRSSLWIYDADQGARLEMPWEAECEYVGDCDVEQAEWLGGSLLNVKIRLGPAERSVPFEVNVEAAASSGAQEEY